MIRERSPPLLWRGQPFLFFYGAVSGSGGQRDVQVLDEEREETAATELSALLSSSVAVLGSKLTR
jgi:hypothetical protein